MNKIDKIFQGTVTTIAALSLTAISSSVEVMGATLANSQEDLSADSGLVVAQTSDLFRYQNQLRRNQMKIERMILRSRQRQNRIRQQQLNNLNHLRYREEQLQQIQSDLNNNYHNTVRLTIRQPATQQLTEQLPRPIKVPLGPINTLREAYDTTVKYHDTINRSFGLSNYSRPVPRFNITIPYRAPSGF